MDEEKKVKKKLNKKNIFWLVFDIILILIVFCIIFIAINHEKIEYYGLGYYLKIYKGYILYGCGTCERHGIEGAGDMETAYICKICGQEYINSTTNVPKICENCSEITNRCQYCGGLLSNY